MQPLRAIPPPYRSAAVAVAISAGLHGVAVVGLRVPVEDEVDLDLPAYTATLQPPAVVVPAPAAAVVAAPKPRPRPARAVRLPEEAVAYLPAPEESAGAPLDALDPLPAVPAAQLPPEPERLAMALPTSRAEPTQAPVFATDALPAELTIAYDLNSVFADGEAQYTWKRDGDRYEITGSAQATGFFAVFLEGRIDQESTGVITPQGLRPERFTERRGDYALEGLAFDWAARSVEFQKGEERRRGQLTENTVDWLSMIFQLAHMPPKGDTLDLRVYTQRRLYQFHLQVLGQEALDLPFGRTNTLHLRHLGDTPEETVDVWLGIEQHYLPVKLRYPVARNRLMVEQTATSIRAR